MLHPPTSVQTAMEKKAHTHWWTCTGRWTKVC
jgi:hypothetical protein